MGVSGIKCIGSYIWLYMICVAMYMTMNNAIYGCESYVWLYIWLFICLLMVIYGFFII